MGGIGDLTDVPPPSTGPYIPRVAALCAGDIREKERFEALPGCHFLNRAANSLRQSMSNGEQGCCTKAVVYLGFRLISYSGLPLALNILSVVVSALLCLLTLPFKSCCGANRWCWTRLQGSCGYALQSLFDLTCDFRQLTGICCCPQDSLYLSI